MLKIACLELCRRITISTKFINTYERNNYNTITGIVLTVSDHEQKLAITNSSTTICKFIALQGRIQFEVNIHCLESLATFILNCNIKLKRLLVMLSGANKHKTKN